MLRSDRTGVRLAHPAAGRRRLPGPCRRDRAGAGPAPARHRLLRRRAADPGPPGRVRRD